jgi:hypothetical protein
MALLKMYSFGTEITTERGHGNLRSTTLMGAAYHWVAANPSFKTV